MKKIALSIMTVGAMFFATQNIQAQDEEMEDIETEVEVEAEQDEFTSLDVMELPQAVTEALMTDYNGAVASEAWVKTKDDTKIYKLKIDVKGEEEKVYIDEAGNWLEKDE
ncbi:MAG: hypothetical protein WB492_11560 [Christiangramia sp.]